MNRQLANKEIISILSDIVEQNKDLRFNQILVAFNIADTKLVANNSISAIDFYQESTHTLDNIKTAINKEVI